MNYDGFPLWHERLLLAKVESSSSSPIWVIYTPDGDMYVESFAASNADIADFRLGTPPGELPPGVPAGQAYRFAARPAGEQLA